MARLEDDALYGGAAGGGKTDAALIEVLRQVEIPYYRGLVVRRTYPQMEALIQRSEQLYPNAYKGAKFKSTTHTWHFPSGAVIIFGSMPHAASKYNYQGKPYDCIVFEEVTQFLYEQYSYLKSRNRANGPGTRVYMRATGNPGGIGHAWVKNRYIDPAPPMTTIWDNIEVQHNGKIYKQRQSRIFVPSSIFDNPALLNNNPGYMATLATLPEAERNALLYGDWSSFQGQAFREFKDLPEHYEDRLYTHVIAPFNPPRHWKCWRGFDFGYTRPYAVGWFVADERGKIYMIRELYGCTGEPNVGVELQPAGIAKLIREVEETDPLLKGRQITGIADPSIFDQSRGPSIADIMAAHPYYVNWLPADNTRLAGKHQCHYRLSFDDYGEPMFQVFNTCPEFIRTTPGLVYDEHNTEDVDTAGEDHLYDMWRYVMMESPITPPLPPDPEILKPDPLNLRKSRIFRI